MDRYWFLTWTTYGSWLQGDRRGSVGRTRHVEARGLSRRNVPGTPPDGRSAYLERLAQARMVGQSLLLPADAGAVLLTQFHETACVRGWELLAVAVMRNHAHVVVGVPLDPDPSTLLRDFKSYGSRALTRGFGKPAAPRWWTESGSSRVLRTEEAVLAAVAYVRDQRYPLLTCVAPGTGMASAGREPRA
jgi:hypothetical protein